MWGTPEGWMPEKMRGRGAGACTGDGAGRISVVIERECTGRSLAADHADSVAIGSALSLAPRLRTRRAEPVPSGAHPFLAKR